MAWCEADFRVWMLFTRLYLPSRNCALVVERTQKAMYEDLYVDMLLESFADAQRLAHFS